jgi:8-oxo-dGTP pyrophosphatase MutT (NUDIX family)
MSNTEPVRPVPEAATVVLLRTAAGAACMGLRPDPCEVFLLRRHGQTGFMPGATVFPGGKVDAADVGVVVAGRTAADCAHLLQVKVGNAATAVFVAAARELHEEAHVLLAVDGAGRPATRDHAQALTAAIDAHRQGHRLAASVWHQELAALGLTVDAAALVPTAHWLTPRAEPRRFDTWFFQAWLPAGQQAELDPHESTDARWMTPRAAVEAHVAGSDVLLPPPTFCTLQALAEGVADPWLAPEHCGPCLEPWFATDTQDGPVIALPWDPVHPDAAAFVAAHPMFGPQRVDRFTLASGRFCRKQAHL